MDIFQLQKKIAIVTSTLGIAVSIINFLYRINAYGVYEALIHASFWSVLAGSLVIMLTGFLNLQAARYLQVLMGFLGGSLAILDSYDSIYGLGLFILFSMIAYKYEIYRKYTVLKILLEIVLVYMMVILGSSQKMSSTKIMLGLDALIYLTIFLFTTFIMYSHEIRGYLRKTRQAEVTITELTEQRLKLNRELEELNEKIDVYNSKNIIVNFDELSITPREQDVIKAMVIYQDTQKDIADRLNISPETVKTHLKHIRDKLDVGRQSEIIEMCRNNFIMEGKK